MFVEFLFWMQASDGVISSPKKAPTTYNIDASDAHNELAVVDYVEDIYRFYKSTEVSFVRLFMRAL
jgi:cyclin B